MTIAVVDGEVVDGRPLSFLESALTASFLSSSRTTSPKQIRTVIILSFGLPD
jgi:hypothetical protein